MIKQYSEDILIEKPAIEIFQSLGYGYQNCYYETFGTNSTLGRETPSDVVLKPRLRNTLIQINSEILSEAIEGAIEELTRDRSSLNPVTANREIYQMLRDGVKVLVKQPDGSEEIQVVKVIDFDNLSNNDFFWASQFWVTGEMYKRRADLVGFINGLPLIFIELKASHKRLENAYRDNLRDYKTTIPQLFWYNALIILSNGFQSRIGSITADWEYFAEWKKINSEGEEGIVSLDTIIRGTCEKAKFIDLLENFTLFQNKDGSFIKILAKNHQYLGVNNAIESFKRIRENQGRLGVFWHTQGSGKSFSMIFFSQKILRKFRGDYTFLIITDRDDLDDQIYGNFQDAGAVTEQKVQAESCEHLRRLLRENHRNIFTLIQKFQVPPGQKYPLLSERSDIIVITDEAHRSQYDTLAMNMRTALPNAAFIAFTGTPLIVGEEKTRETFGDYVSIYDFKQSIDDGATVPLYYENRIPELQLKNEDLDEDFAQIIEEALLDEDQEKKLEREFARQYHLITRNDRLDKIAEDIVAHFINRGYMGKAMVVSIDKPTAVKMFNKVQTAWKKYLENLKAELKKTEDQGTKKTLKEKIQFMQETDMAVVVSGEQNEEDKFKKLGLDIKPHRLRVVKEDLDDKFKDEKDPFRIVFVCAMWMTGFDVPCLSTIYLDKPMRNHTLMQTIARANRVFRDKSNGLIVDYIGVFRNLQKALAIYGSGTGGTAKGGETPVKPKSDLLKELTKAIDETSVFCREKGVDPKRIIEAEKLHRVKALDDAVDALLVNEETKKKYLTLSGNVIKLYKGILPDPEAVKFTEICVLFKIIAEKIRSLSSEVDISEVMNQVETLLDDSIETDGYVIDRPFGPEGDHIIDLSKIDFEALKRIFAKGHKHIQIEKLKGKLNAKMKQMIRQNRTRISFLEKFQALIDEYNTGTEDLDLFFNKLLLFAQELNEEDKRSISENLSQEELAIFDLLKKSDLTKKEVNQIKQVSRTLLETLKKEKLVLDWRKKQQARADVLSTIQHVLDDGLPRTYAPELFQQKCDAVFGHVYEAYFGAGKSIYQDVA
ncbi:MAG: type I restriction endonuclease subunit R [Phycisphaerae bacterium]